MDVNQYNQVLRAIGKKHLFAQGDEAYAYGALLAGCRFFAGYPITPATEAAEVMSQLLPRVGGTYVQMEDEIASMGAIYDRNALCCSRCPALRSFNRAADRAIPGRCYAGALGFPR